MKIASVALLATFAAAAQGFSVTMSSIGYLDKLAGGSVQLSSFGSSSGYAPAPSPMPYSAPSSYGAPAPAPASSSYTSAFANAPGNKDLDYLKTLAGGNSMKGGRNYAGVASSFRALASGNLYLDALKGQTMAPASYSTNNGYSAPQSYGAAAPSPMPYSAPSSYSAPAPSSSYGSSAPAPAFGGYLDNLNGAVSSSYSTMQNSFASATNYNGVNPKPKSAQSAFGGYLQNL